MVLVRVAGVALDSSGQHVLLLKPVDQIPGDGLVLPIILVYNAMQYRVFRGKVREGDIGYH